MSDVPLPLPSSTVILLRDDGDFGTPFSLLMLERHGSVTFPGVHAFPGGVVDPGDHAFGGLAVAPDQSWAAGDDADDAETALPYWVAAVREVFEEVGLLLAYRAGTLVHENLASPYQHARARLHEGASFAAELGALGLTPATDRLYSFSRWITPPTNPRRFDTRFLVGRLPQGQEAVVDGTETVSCTWFTPAAALDAYLAGEIQLIPPTVRTLDDLARFETIDDVLHDAASRQVRAACPGIIDAGDGVFHMDYPEFGGRGGVPPRRLMLVDGRWRPPGR